MKLQNERKKRKLRNLKKKRLELHRYGNTASSRDAENKSFPCCDRPSRNNSWEIYLDPFLIADFTQLICVSKWCNDILTGS